MSFGMGLVPAESRRVKPLPIALRGLVPVPNDGFVTVKSRFPDTEADTMPLIITKSKRTAWQTKKLADKLNASTLEETLRNDSQFVLDYIRYKKDDPEHEQVRSPRRLIHEGAGDCDCFAVLLATLLNNQGIPFAFRIAKYEAGDWSHIYIVVPKTPDASLDNRNEYIVLDPVTNRHDHEVSFTEKKDYPIQNNSTVKRQGLKGLQYLDGCGPAPSDPGSSQAAATTTESTKRSTETIPVKTLINQGYKYSDQILTDLGVPFSLNPDGTLTVPTTEGNKLIPAMLSPDQVQSTTTQLTEDQKKMQVAVAATQPATTMPAPSGRNLLVGLGLFILGGILLGSSSKGSLSGPKKIPVLKI